MGPIHEEKRKRLRALSIRLWCWNKKYIDYPRGTYELIYWGEGANGPFVRYNNTGKFLKHFSRYLTPPDEK